MEFERDAMVRLGEILIEKGYPLNTIRYDALSGKKRADLVVHDPGDATIPLAVFEIKRNFNPHRWDEKFQQTALQLKGWLQSANIEIAPLSIPVFLVTFSKESSDLIFYQLSGDWLSGKTDALYTTRLDDLPSYSTLAAQRRRTDVGVIKKEEKAAVDHFKRLCWGLAAAVTALLVVDWVGWHTITVTQLSLIGAIAALVVFPYVTKLKVLGIEMERAKNEVLVFQRPEKGPTLE